MVKEYIFKIFLDEMSGTVVVGEDESIIDDYCVDHYATRDDIIYLGTVTIPALDKKEALETLDKILTSIHKNGYHLQT